MVRSKRSIADYDASFEPVRAARKSRDGNQPGDPVKAARAMLKLIEAANPPTHLMLGPDALKFVREDRKAFDEEVLAWESLSASTNFD
jgi:hypothetical protein